MQNKSLSIKYPHFYATIGRSGKVGGWTAKDLLGTYTRFRSLSSPGCMFLVKALSQTASKYMTTTDIVQNFQNVTKEGVINENKM